MYNVFYSHDSVTTDKRVNQQSLDRSEDNWSDYLSNRLRHIFSFS